MSDIIDDFDPKTGNSKSKRKLNPILIHIGFLLLLLVIIGIVFFADFSFFDDEPQQPKLTLVGNQENFSIPYSGDVVVETSEFSLKTNSGKFDGNSQEFRIANYSGDISLVGTSIIFSGDADNISFGKNEISLSGSSFSLNSSKRTKVSFYLDELDMNFNDGVVKFADRLTYDFENASVLLNGANTTMTYDGVFSFKGYVESFSVNTTNNVKISYVKPVEVEE